MIDKNNLFNSDFLDALKDLSINQKDLSSIYTYLSLFGDDLEDEEKAFWSIILEKFDPDYDEEDESDDIES